MNASKKVKSSDRFFYLFSTNYILSKLEGSEGLFLGKFVGSKLKNWSKVTVFFVYCLIGFSSCVLGVNFGLIFSYCYFFYGFYS